MKKAAPSTHSPLLGKIERGNVMAPSCPSRKILGHITSQWGVLILIVLETGTHRFGELRRKIDGISERMLSQTLQNLEADGLVQRSAYDSVPPHVDYRLTPLGHEGARKVRDLTDWIEVNLPNFLKAHNSTNTL